MPRLRSQSGWEALETEVVAEKAAALGSAGRRLEAELNILKANHDHAAQQRLEESAADATYSYFVQRELLGLVDHSMAIEHYAIPKSVIALVGVITPRSR